MSVERFHGEHQGRLTATAMNAVRDVRPPMIQAFTFTPRALHPAPVLRDDAMASQSRQHAHPTERHSVGSQPSIYIAKRRVVANPGHATHNYAEHDPTLWYQRDASFPPRIPGTMPSQSSNHGPSSETECQLRQQIAQRDKEIACLRQNLSDARGTLTRMELDELEYLRYRLSDVRRTLTFMEHGEVAYLRARLSDFRHYVTERDRQQRLDIPQEPQKQGECKDTICVPDWKLKTPIKGGIPRQAASAASWTPVNRFERGLNHYGSSAGAGIGSNPHQIHSLGLPVGTSDGVLIMREEIVASKDKFHRVVLRFL
ncbi:hypothetical protein K461DRAFT_309476 [Myriangium duriaei CBS 260.36]|uniref:Uncharacterized protein n=1 Tax=Myriangium duriaei CBS 260.36 TaxID=1168546 RepID=A0A9P4MLG6_9PEZI|nr:hypothetical protein K461DRAFT_309476 [Myriangium duriaei CBS 260.36]